MKEKVRTTNQGGKLVVAQDRKFEKCRDIFSDILYGRQSQFCHD